MKRLVLILLIPFLIIGESEITFSQIIHFRAKNSFTGETVEIDSLRIYLDDLNSIVLVKPIDSLDVNILGVNEWNSPNNISNQVLFENKSFNTEIGVRTLSNLKIDIFDYSLKLVKTFNRILTQGNYKINIDFSSAPRNLYFIRTQNQNDIQIYKVLNCSNNSSEFNPILIILPELVSKVEAQENKITCIAYAKHFYPDTLSMMKPKNDTTINFNMTKSQFNNYRYRNCNIEFNLPVILRKEENNKEGPNPTQHVSFDTIYYKHSIIFSNELGSIYKAVPPCDTVNVDSIININKCMYEGVGANCHFKAFINFEQKKLDSMSYIIREGKGVEPNILTEIHFIVNNLSIDSFDESNLTLYSSVTSISEIKKFTFYEKQISFPYPFHFMTKTNTVNGIYPMFDKTYIKIELFE